jgi:hypothetical protein
LAISNG